MKAQTLVILPLVHPPKSCLGAQLLSNEFSTTKIDWPFSWDSLLSFLFITQENCFQIKDVV